MKRVVAALIAILTVVSVHVLLAGNSSADHRPWPDRVREPDRNAHTFCFDPDFPMDAATRDRARRAMGNADGLMAMTVISTDELSTCLASVDVRFQDREADGSYGDAFCVRVWENGQCDRFRVRVDVDGTIRRDANTIAYQVRKTICHEVGHTVGLWHYGNGDPYVASSETSGANNCMRSGIWDNGNAWTRTYGTHDRTEINANW